VEVGDYSADGKQQLAHEPSMLKGLDDASAPTLEAVQTSAATSSRLKR
jgi:hypothetical protein